MRTTLITLFLLSATITLFSQPFSERELFKSEDIVKSYCSRLTLYSNGIDKQRFGIEDLFGSIANEVYNDLEPGSATVALSTYLNNIISKQPILQFGLLPSRNEWEYVSDDGQGRRLLVITVPKEVDSRRVTNVFYISLKEHPVTGETMVTLANILPTKKPGFTYHKLKGGTPPPPAFRNFTETVSGTPIEMVAIKGGTFQMGSPESEPERSSNETQHTVTVSDFYMGKFEVTVSQFEVFINSTGHQTDAVKAGWSYCWNGSGWEQKAGTDWRCDVSGAKRPQSEYSHPVIHVSWNDAVAYCNWISQQTGKTYRLPTEAEWEYAARAGTTTPFNTGNCLSTSQANYNGDYPYTGCSKGEYRQKTLPVGSFSANAWGLYDMHGNVWEWCNDWYNAGYYSISPRNNPPGPPSGSYRVLRGGSWYYIAGNCRVSNRDNFSPGNSPINLGFRLVLVPV